MKFDLHWEAGRIPKTALANKAGYHPIAKVLNEKPAADDGYSG
ncbi:hypothetical protein [Spongiibacter taiwanensis]|nr:hypothetical protein [Spongiibacter taiwanensis]